MSNARHVRLTHLQNLMDDLDDQLLDQEEMNDMFSRPIGQDSFMTDADLESGKNWIDICRSDLIFPFEELAGLAESEFGIDSGAMYNDLHAPSVPVQPLDGGRAAASTTKVRLPSLDCSIECFSLGWCNGRRIRFTQTTQPRHEKLNFAILFVDCWLVLL